jgi:hypothetical protein
MFAAKNIAIAGLLALSVSGCEQSLGFPDIAPRFSPDSRDVPWPTFLPKDVIEGIALADFEQEADAIRSVQYRVYRLRQRATLLRAPIIEAQERLRLSQAVKRHGS